MIVHTGQGKPMEPTGVLQKNLVPVVGRICIGSPQYRWSTPPVEAFLRWWEDSTRQEPPYKISTTYGGLTSQYTRKCVHTAPSLRLRNRLIVTESSSLISGLRRNPTVSTLLKRRDRSPHPTAVVQSNSQKAPFDVLQATRQVWTTTLTMQDCYGPGKSVIPKVSKGKGEIHLASHCCNKGKRSGGRVRWYINTSLYDHLEGREPVGVEALCPKDYALVAGEKTP